MANRSDERKKSHTIHTDFNGRRNGMEADKDKTLSHLRSELIKDVDVMDEFEVEKLESVVAEIEKIEDEQIDFNTTKALEHFSTNILQKAIHQESTLSAIKEKSSKRLAKANQRSSMKHKLVKIVSIAASVLIILISSNFVTIAIAGFNIFKPFIEWSEETFTIKSKNEIQNPIILENGQKLYFDFKYVLRDYGEDIALPSYIPKGYELIEIRAIEDAESKLLGLVVRYALEDSPCMLMITSQPSSDESQTLSIEKNSAPVNEFSVDGVDCYIFKNNNWNIGVWYDNKYYYHFSGDFSYEEIEKVIRSSIQH